MPPTGRRPPSNSMQKFNRIRPASFPRSRARVFSEHQLPKSCIRPSIGAKNVVPVPTTNRHYGYRPRHTAHTSSTSLQRTPTTRPIISCGRKKSVAAARAGGRGSLSIVGLGWEFVFVSWGRLCKTHVTCTCKYMHPCTSALFAPRKSTQRGQKNPLESSLMGSLTGSLTGCWSCLIGC